jgi:hypothetical protein
MCDYWGLATLLPFGEGLACEHLGRQGFELYSPNFLGLKVLLCREVETVSPLFPGYLVREANRALARRVQHAWRECAYTRPHQNVQSRES